MEYLSIGYEPGVSLGTKAVWLNHGTLQIGCCSLWVCYLSWTWCLYLYVKWEMKSINIVIIRLCQVMTCHESVSIWYQRGIVWKYIIWLSYLREKLECNHLIYSNGTVNDYMMLFKPGYTHEWAIIRVISISYIKKVLGT